MSRPATYIKQVGDARPAENGLPSAGPIYKSTLPALPVDETTPTTLFEVFERSVQQFTDSPCLGSRNKGADGTVGPYTWLTYGKTHEKVVAIASALKAAGLAPQDRVGIYGGNAPEWMIAMQACNRLSLHCVPLYDSLGENAVEYIINHSESTAAFVAGNKLRNFVKSIDNVKERVKTLVYWGESSEEVTTAAQTAKDAGVAVHSFEEFLELGKASPAEAVPPKPTDLCTIMYTSGTTGEPKGVMLSHDAVTRTVLSLVHMLKHHDIEFKAGDTMLSYLPLAHIFDRTSEEMFLLLGGGIGYWQGEITKLVEDIDALKPAMFIGVPRVFDRIYSRATAQVEASAVKKLLYNYASSRKMHFLKSGRGINEASPFFDKLVFSKFKQRLGGNVKVICSGGAPLASHVEDFLRVAMCCPVVQGYGLTESCAASFIAVPDEIRMASTVGPPMPLVEFRLESVPEMGYDALHETEPKGEVLIRTPQLFNGYYKADDKTAEVLEKDGWFHTGDVGTITPEGALKIIDRKKNIFKLSQGEYVAAEKVEASYKKNTLVDQVFVYGNSFKSQLVGVVVPNKEQVEAQAKSLGLEGSFEELVAKPDINKWVLEQLNATAKEEKLKGFEMLRAIHLDSEQFSVENDLMTPTFKLKRAPLQKKYQAQIDTMYETLEKASK